MHQKGSSHISAQNASFGEDSALVKKQLNFCHVAKVLKVKADGTNVVCFAES